MENKNYSDYTSLTIIRLKELLYILTIIRLKEILYTFYRIY